MPRLPQSRTRHSLTARGVASLSRREWRRWCRLTHGPQGSRPPREDVRPWEQNPPAPPVSGEGISRPCGRRVSGAGIRCDGKSVSKLKPNRTEPNRANRTRPWEPASPGPSLGPEAGWFAPSPHRPCSGHATPVRRGRGDDRSEDAGNRPPRGSCPGAKPLSSAPDQQHGPGRPPASMPLCGLCHRRVRRGGPADDTRPQACSA